MVRIAHMPYLATAALLGGFAFAQTQPPAAPPGESNPPTAAPGSSPTMSQSYPDSNPPAGISDKSFVKKTAEQTATEVEISKLAQQKGSSDAVKQLSQRIVEDQAKTSPALTSAASKVNVDIPTDLPKGGKKTVDKLSKLSGPDFDRAYAKTILSDEKSNVDYFTQEAQQGKVAEVKDFAVKTLPTVQQHRKMAEQLEASIKK